MSWRIASFSSLTTEEFRCQKLVTSRRWQRRRPAARRPNSITLDNGFVWVAYTNGADSTGKSGHSTVVEYDPSGNVVQTYNIAGYVDGLKLNLVTGDIWALQNQDGNSKLAIIDPVTQSVSHFSYKNPSASRGYDDVVFENGKVFLSYTNPPGTSGDPVLVELTNGNEPSGLLTTTTVLTDGIKGINTATGTLQSVPITDPDSLQGCAQWRPAAHWRERRRHPRHPEPRHAGSGGGVHRGEGGDARHCRP